MPHFITHDAVDDAESIFPYSELIVSDYFRKYRTAYFEMIDKGFQIGKRNYLNLLQYISEIYTYNEQHTNGFAKVLRSAGNDWRNCEAIFSEIIVYRYYVRLVYEGIIKSVDKIKNQCDIIIKRLDNSLAFLEVFCVMPRLSISGPDKTIINEIKTHTQDESASIRQKLLRKIEKQKQFTEPRENFAVIELNDTCIAGDFAILSSLSDGYKITFDKKSGKKRSEDYDWRTSVFQDRSTEFLKGIIYFSLGAYESRKYIENPMFKSAKNSEHSDSPEDALRHR